jgi:hypothetical protein
MGKVWALFTDNSACEIKIRKLDAGQKESPKFIPVCIDDMRARVSAEKALRSAFFVLMTNNRLYKKQKYSFSYEFTGTNNYIDSSTSLAFALGLVMKSHTFPFSIAATGVIEESSQTATVKRVDKIENKMLAAISVLKPGDIIFYPQQENNDEISQTIIEKAHLNKIKLQPVTTVKDAVSLIFKYNNEKLYFKTSGCSLRKITYVLLISLLLAFILLFLSPFILNLDHNQQDTKNYQPQLKKKLVTNNPVNEEIKNEPVQQENIIHKKRKIRIKFSLKGNHQKTVLDVQRLLSNFFQNNGFIINNRQYDGVVSGNINLTEIKEKPLRPYAPPDAIIVQYRLSIQNLTFSSNKGDTLFITSVPYWIEVMKSQQDILKNLSIKKLYQQILQDLFKRLKNFIFNLIKIKNFFISSYH